MNYTLYYDFGCMSYFKDGDIYDEREEYVYQFEYEIKIDEKCINDYLGLYDMTAKGLIKFLQVYETELGIKTVDDLTYYLLNNDKYGAKEFEKFLEEYFYDEAFKDCKYYLEYEWE